ncbi:MAG TPA: hypothetical protein VMU15_03490 [Anaeromyxobacter sp.]|nr:hypothetical protein [Anaeromyxobacter sp.]
MLQAKTADGPRWPRGQKFTPSALGREALEAYRLAVQQARGVGRGALDAALAAWAAPLRVEAGDGVLLGELLERPRGLADLSRALEDAGHSTAEVRAAVGRLVAAGLVEPVVVQAPEPDEGVHPARWART